MEELRLMSEIDLLEPSRKVNKIDLVWAGALAILSFSFYKVVDVTVDNYMSQAKRQTEAYEQISKSQSEMLNQITSINIKLETADFTTMRNDIERLKFKVSILETGEIVRNGKNKVNLLE